MERYFDKSGNEIMAGMNLKHDDGEVSTVHASDDDLGFNASNENHVSFNSVYREIYPLYQFNLKEWEIVKGGAYE